MAKKPVLLWRVGSELSGRQPDDFQDIPTMVGEKLIEIWKAEGRIVVVLVWDAEAEDVTVERHTPDT